MTDRARLRTTIEDLELILGFETIGRADRQRRIRRIKLTLDRIAEYQAARIHTGDVDRGGSSSPSESDDRREESALDQQAARDDARLTQLLDSLAPIARDLRAIVQRNTAVIDKAKIPKNTNVPGCVSCARSTTEGRLRIGGHWAPIYDKSQDRKLCRWCYDHSWATELPPINACHLLHTEGPRQAAKWLATHRRDPHSALS